MARLCSGGSAPRWNNCHLSGTCRPCGKARFRRSPLYIVGRKDNHDVVAPIDPERTKIHQQLDLVHWHMLRGDGLRAGLASRAGSLLSTDALIVAGVALALGLGNQRPGYDVLAASLVTLLCVAVSVFNASMVLITVRRWHQQFNDLDVPSPFLYSYVGMHGSFEEFKVKVLSESPEGFLEYALVELWRCGRLHNYRYRKLRNAIRRLLAALVLLFLTIALSAA